MSHKEISHTSKRIADIEHELSIARLIDAFNANDKATIINLKSERDTYRDLCGDLIKKLKSINENMAGTSEYGGFYYETQLLIIKAETVMGNKS